MSRWRSMKTAPSDRRVLVDFRGAGPIVAFRDRDFPEMWVRYVGYGKSSRYPLVHADYALGWMPLPKGSAEEVAPQQTDVSGAVSGAQTGAENASR